MKRLALLAVLAISCGSGAGGGDAPLALPVAADDLFAASGYMGDGSTPGALADAQACTQRAGDKKGKCHKFSYTPGTVGWAGIYWQFPANNWGTGGQAGQTLPVGAQSISFWAWGAKGGETVTFFAGLQPYDGFYVATNPIPLTTTPTQYTLNLAKVTYSTVIGGFGWSTQAQGNVAVNFYVDDIEWKKDAAITQVPGCTDSKAANYNAGATSDDGSCEYNVTFQLDLTGTNTPATAKVQVRADFNGYCDYCNPLALQSGQTWTVTLPLKPKTYAYKFATDSTQAGFEVVPTACSSDPSLTDADRTRKLVVTTAAQTLPLTKFGACPPGS